MTQAVFRTLADAKYYETSLAGPGIIVTVRIFLFLLTLFQLTSSQGKGYPDLASRAFLRILHLARTTVPVMCLVDYDVDGIRIMRCFKSGSQSLAHECNGVEAAKWLGIRSRHVLRDLSDPPTASITETQTSQSQSQSYRSSNTSQESYALSTQSLFLIPQQAPSYSHSIRQNVEIPRRTLNLRDRNLALHTLRTLDISGEADLDILMELQTMLMLNIKAEIYAAGNVEGLTEMLDEEMTLEVLQKETSPA